MCVACLDGIRRSPGPPLSCPAECVLGRADLGSNSGTGHGKRIEGRDPIAQAVSARSAGLISRSRVWGVSSGRGCNQCGSGCAPAPAETPGGEAVRGDGSGLAGGLCRSVNWMIGRGSGDGSRIDTAADRAAYRRKHPSAISDEVAPFQPLPGRFSTIHTASLMLLLAEGAFQASGDDQRQPERRTDRDRESRGGRSFERFRGLFSGAQSRHIACAAMIPWCGSRAASVRQLRRSRGFVPVPVFSRSDQPSVLAVGGELKNTICLTQGKHAFLSQHVGDLENVESYQLFPGGHRAPRAHPRNPAPRSLPTTSIPTTSATKLGAAAARGETGRCAAPPRPHRKLHGGESARRARDRLRPRWYRLRHRRNHLGGRSAASPATKASSGPLISSTCRCPGERLRSANLGGWR
jgi:hypothetical protein